jgi:hypothetical protein
LKADEGFVDATLHQQPGWQVQAAAGWHDRAAQQSGQVKLTCPQLGPLEAVLPPYQRQGVAWLQFLRENKFGGILVDEIAQHIKNRQTQNALAVKAVRTGHRLVLTGAPMENSMLELWSIIDFLMPAYLGAATDFRERYERCQLPNIQPPTKMGATGRFCASTKRPRFAEGARKQLARTFVTQDALRLRVPFDLAPHKKRDETQVPGKGGMMRHFHRRHRGLARLDGVEEVAKVSTLGKRQFHFALVLPE